MCRYVVHVWDVKKNHIRYIFNSSIFTAVLEVPRCTSLKVNYRVSQKTWEFRDEFDIVFVMN